MTTGIAVARANAAIDASVALGTWIKLHVGDPGAAGTANAAANTTRQQATMGAASGGVAANTADLTWTSVSTTEIYTHFSMWTASTAGTFLWSGTVTGGSVTAGDDFTANTGSLTLSMTGASLVMATNTLKVLGQTKPTAATLTDTYTVPGATQAVVSTVSACNQSATGTSIRVSVAVAGAADTAKQYVVYDMPIGPNATIDITIGITLGAADVIRCYCTLATVSFNAFGQETA